MMGRLERDQGQLFYSFCLEEVVPDDHLVRAISAVLDLSWVYGELSPHYPALGRPSIDPVLMIRMLILGYAFGLRSERLLCREIKVNLAYRWFCGLSIEDKIPDHSAFSRARNERFRDNDIFRRVFERVVEACISAGLVGGKEFAVDASLIAADEKPSREGVYGNPRRLSFRRCHQSDAEVRLAVRSGRPMDWRDARTSIFRIFRQLSDRCEGWRHHGCRGVARHPPGGGRRVEDDD